MSTFDWKRVACVFVGFVIFAPTLRFIAASLTDNSVVIVMAAALGGALGAAAGLAAARALSRHK